MWKMGLKIAARGGVFGVGRAQTLQPERWGGPSLLPTWKTPGFGWESATGDQIQESDNLSKPE